MILIWPSLIIDQMAQVRRITWTQRLKPISEMKTLEIILSETTRLRALIFGMKLHLVDLYKLLFKLCSWAKNGPTRGHMFYIDLYRENMKKNFLSETTRPRALIFGM